MSERDRTPRKGAPQKRSGARPFQPGEAPLGVRPGLGGQRRRAGVEGVTRPPLQSVGAHNRSALSAAAVGQRAQRRRLQPESVRHLKRLLVSLLLLAALIAPPALAAGGSLTISSVHIVGLQLLDESAVRAATGVTLGDRLLSTDPRSIERALDALPFVASSRVRIGLPGEIRIEIHEFAPLMRWRSGGVTYLVNGRGELLGPTTSPVLSAAGRATLEQFLLITDLRSQAVLLPGGAISPLDFEIATRLASLTLADVGSAATLLSIEVDPQFGFVLRGTGAGIAWNAVFGIYSATIRPPEMLPGQVRLLRSLLANHERRVGWIILADGQAGTFTAPGVRPPAPPQVSPSPSTSPSPSLVLP